MGWDAQIPLTEVNKHNQLGNGIGVEIDQIQPIVVQQPSEERANRQPKPAVEIPSKDRDKTRKNLRVNPANLGSP